MRTRYKITDDQGLHFITSTIVEWIPVFTTKPYFDILVQSFAFCQQHKALRLFGFVILDNHFHAIVAGPNLTQTITGLKKFTAKKIIAQLQTDRKAWLLNQLAYFKKRHKTRSTYQVWQEGYHPQLVTSEEMFHQKMTYIHNNPVKRGLVSDPEHWIYSSARHYLVGDDRVIRLDSLGEH